jgi:thiol-disulfide isomerase/thioredoxin
MRPPTADIPAPPFPRGLTWINSSPLRMDRLLGRAVLIEFWDFCRPNSLRTLPYLKEWHERYGDAGLRVIGVHAAGFETSADPEAVRAATGRLEVPYPVVVDAQMEIWGLYGNLGWPARYLFDAHGVLFDYHYGEGAYEETERAIQELLELDRPPIPPKRAEDVPGARLALQSDDVEGAYSGPYEAGAVWGVFDGRGTLTANGRTIEVTHPGCYALIEHERHTSGRLDLRLGPGVRCDGVCFLPGLSPTD